MTVTYRDAQSVDDVEDTATVEEGRRGTGAAEATVEGDRPVMATSANAVRAVPDANDPPVFASGITREVKENTEGPDGKVGDPVTADDPDGDALTYSLSGGADMDAFGIDDETGQITVGAGTDLDYEGGQRTYVVEVTADDPFDGSDSTTVTIMVINVNEPPDLMLIVEDEPVTPPEMGDVMGPSAVDFVEETTGAVATYTSAGATSWMLSGNDAGDFDISAGGELSFAVPPDYENPGDADLDNDYEVTVEARNGTLNATLDVTVTVTNDTSDDAPTNGNGNGEFDPWSYDADSSGTIDRPEVITAIRDYFADPAIITRDQVIEVIRLYFDN